MRSATSISRSIVLLRRTSVGCAVNTGTTMALAKKATRCTGGIAAWRAGSLPLKELLREAATPGGTAAAVIASLDNAGYAKIIAQGLRAGIRQAHKNAKS